MEGDKKMKVVEEQLLQMGYCQPDWDNFRIHKPPPSTLASCSIPLKPNTMSKKQLFLIKVWPKVEGFYQEDEDPTTISHSETVVKNNMLTRIFRLSFDNQNQNSQQRWLFVLEKRIDPGEDGVKRHIRQNWAIYASVDELPKYAEKFMYTRSFETHCQSSKYKMNKEPGVVSTLKKSFFAEIKASLADLFQNENLDVDLTDLAPNCFFKGKEFQFEECGNQIFWTVSIRPIPKNVPLQKTWMVNTDEKSLMLKTSKSLLRSRNPFEDEGDSISLVEQLEIDRQIVERNILDFINYVWPKVRNYYLELEGIDTSNDMSFAATNAVKNGYPTRTLELHFDTLNEQTRWKCLFEISLVSRISTKDWVRKIDPTENYVEKRTYSSYEKRGTSSIFGEDKNEYFQGFYKRWFLNEVQWKLVKCYSYDGKVLQSSVDESSYDFGKDLEFSIDGENITWSVSVQKITKYPVDEVPSNVWCYGLTNNFLPGESDEEELLSESDFDAFRSEDSSDIDADLSFASNVTNISSITLAERIKKKSQRFRTLAQNIVRPVMKRPSWLNSTTRLLRFKSRKNCKEEHLKNTP
ncbi:unnamed protein product [Allacma fusca]|uniref:Uncharacterized protein n=1 Tax=Allacma fusca TaxID=39272 RepID=A0A8J2P2R9_9HEXA|nr:unnamed protein product [Allacma fusca]